MHGWRKTSIDCFRVHLQQAYHAALHSAANVISVLLTHTHPFNGPLSGTARVSRYQKGKTNLDFTEARDSEWQWHQLGHMQVCTSLQTENHASTRPLSFLQAGCPSCRPTNSVKALKAAEVKSCTQTCFNQQLGCISSWQSEWNGSHKNLRG